jgi:hypothetical protein
MRMVKIAPTLLGSAGILLLLSLTVRAAPVEAVIKACDNTAGCNYSTDKNGNIAGCSGHACFFCDGKTRQCDGVTFRKGQPVLTGIRGKIPGGLKNAPTGGTSSSSAGNKPVNETPVRGTEPVTERVGGKH